MKDDGRPNIGGGVGVSGGMIDSRAGRRWVRKGKAGPCLELGPLRNRRRAGKRGKMSASYIFPLPTPAPNTTPGGLGPISARPPADSFV